MPTAAQRIGRQLRALLRSRGGDIDWLAKKTGKRRDHVEAVLHGYPNTRAGTTMLDTVDDIAAALGASLEVRSGGAKPRGSSLFFHATPIADPEHLRPSLGRPEHLRKGKSAYELCRAWLDANGLPARVRAVLDTDPYYRGAVLAEGLFEHEVDLGTRGRPSQTDLLTLLRLGCCHAVIAVEGKAGESLGPLIKDWLRDDGGGRAARLADLARQLGMDGEADSELRYQLLHRTVSALREARRYRVDEAMLLIHSFARDDNSVADNRAFASAIGVSGADVDRVSDVREIDGLRLRLACVQDQPG